MTGPRDVAEYAVGVAEEIADSMFEEHQKHIDCLTEEDRDKWKHAYIAGFAAGYTTAIMRASAVVDDAMDMKAKVTQPGVN